jgi:hypothetical protein
LKPNVTVVSGLPRSGTSMMMKMLAAGGKTLMSDGIRRADEDNPGGYFECEKVKKLKVDNTWLAQAAGKAVKVVSRLLNDLPADCAYQVIFMQRNLDEILASQAQMLRRLGQPAGDADDREMRDLFIGHLRDVENWLSQQSRFSVLYINYNQILVEPRVQSLAVKRFLGGELNVDQMAAVVDEGLYRQRAP